MKIPFLSWGGSHLDESGKKLHKDKGSTETKSPETENGKKTKPSNWLREISKGMLWLWGGDGTDPDKSKRLSVLAVVICLFCFWLLQDKSPLWHSLWESKTWFAVFLILIIPLAVKFPKYASIIFGLSLVWVLIDSKVEGLGNKMFGTAPQIVAPAPVKEIVIQSDSTDWSDSAAVNGRHYGLSIASDVNLVGVKINDKVEYKPDTQGRVDISPNIRVMSLRFKTDKPASVSIVFKN